MLGIVWADGLLTLFVFWELTSITSFLLIGFDDENAAARAAATRAFLVTGAGGLAMLAGFIILTIVGDATTISELVADPPTGTLTNVALVLVLVGAFTKSAQFPFHFWLPGAMAAPTPVSAYLHSATMVKAGLVVVARFAPRSHRRDRGGRSWWAQDSRRWSSAGSRPCVSRTPSWLSPTARSANSAS